MSIVSNTEQTPRRIWVLCNLIATHGPMARGNAQSLMIPVGEGGQFPVLLREAVRLELLQEVEGSIEIVGSEARKVAREESEFLRYIDTKLFVDPASNTDENRHVRYALAWLLSRSPSDKLLKSTNFRALMLEDMDGDEDYGVSNDLRSGMLFYWARFAGYATGFGLSLRGPSLFVPDPTDAVARRLARVFGRTRELPINEFLDRLSECCPVLEGGKAREVVDARMKVKRRLNYLSPATSLALKRLERRGLLRLSEKSDAKQTILLDVFSGEGARVTHVATGAQ